MRLAKIADAALLALPREDVEEHRLVHRAIEALDADYYAIFERDGSWYLDAGGTEKGPFATRAEAVMAKKTGDGYWSQFTIAQLQRNLADLKRDLKDTVDPKEVDGIRKDIAEVEKEISKKRSGDSLSAIARDALDCWYVPGQEPATGVYSKYNAGDSLSAIARDALMGDALRGDGWNYVVSNNQGSYVEKSFPYSKEGLNDAYAFAARNGMAVWEAHNGSARYLLRQGARGGDSLTDLVERARSGLREQTGDVK